VSTRAITNLVLGSEGFVGRSLCEFLRRQGEAVIHFDIKRGGHEDARHVELPLGEATRVYFLAWEVGGAKYLYQDEVQFRQLEWNLRLMLNVLPQLRQSQTPFLFVSSQLAEESDTVYGVTKRLGEVWTRLLGGVRLRLWNIYGGYEDASERSHVVADFVHQALATGEIRMLTSGRELRQFIHVDDVCSAFHIAMTDQPQGVYDVTSFEWVSVRAVADVIAALTGARVVPGAGDGRTPITPMLGKIPGWQARLTLEAGLARMVDEYKRREQLQTGS
jgi:nucleoside-diphosphate-sugar epimerase